ncbi:hypothetical protein Nepgr_011642 [Nepenthes gracilis]|uniref:Uncharacterized protein n=1 Tax=Nepenthes gracilis TaxID=150966 RepID=A0AAD3SFH9_NEPGR|nr:hypothetical protein Nepgr_011642 [Nepenthes gracilis]
MDDRLGVPSCSPRHPSSSIKGVFSSTSGCYPSEYLSNSYYPPLPATRLPSSFSILALPLITKKVNSLDAFGCLQNNLRSDDFVDLEVSASCIQEAKTKGPYGDGAPPSAISKSPAHHKNASTEIGNLPPASLSGTVNIEKLAVEVPKGCDKDVLFRDRVEGDQQLVSNLVGAGLELGSSYSFPVDSRSSPTRDLASSDVVDGRLINPITTASSIAHLSPDGKETHGDIAFSPVNVEGLQGYVISAGGASISFVDILKHGIHSKDVDEPGTCGAH